VIDFRAISTGTCWYRQHITDTYPEGTAWQSQQFQVASLSVGPNNHVRYITVKTFAQARMFESIPARYCFHLG